MHKSDYIPGGVASLLSDHKKKKKKSRQPSDKDSPLTSKIEVQNLSSLFTSPVADFILNQTKKHTSKKESVKKIHPKEVQPSKSDKKSMSGASSKKRKIQLENEESKKLKKKHTSKKESVKKIHPKEVQPSKSDKKSVSGASSKKRKIQLENEESKKLKLKDGVIVPQVTASSGGENVGGENVKIATSASRLKARQNKAHYKEKARKAKHTVFVGNLPNSTEKKDLKKLFKSFGKIETVRFRSAAPADLKTPKKVAVIKQEFHPGRSSMNGYVVFENEEDARKSLSLNGKQYQGNTIRVDIASDAKEHDNQRSVFVGNVPFDVKEDALHDHFKDCGDIVDVRVIRDKKTGLGKGFAYICFKEVEGKEFALSLNSQLFQKKRPLRIQKAVSSMGQKAVIGNKKLGDSVKNTKRLKPKKPKKPKSKGKLPEEQVISDKGSHLQNVSNDKIKKKVKSTASNQVSTSFQGFQAEKTQKMKQKKNKKKLIKKKKMALTSNTNSSNDKPPKKVKINKSKTVNISGQKSQRSKEKGKVKKVQGSKTFARNRMSKKMRKGKK